MAKDNDLTEQEKALEQQRQQEARERDSLSISCVLTSLRLR